MPFADLALTALASARASWEPQFPYQIEAWRACLKRPVSRLVFRRLKLQLR